MKREWEIDELVEHFSLSGPEMTLLHGKTEPNQLGLAILLKYFQYEGQFPDHKRAIPRAVVTFIAEQLAVDEKVFDQYSWKARTISRERILIRQHLGFREAIEDDRTTLTVWLTEHAAMQHEHNERYWLDMAYHRLRELHIEPFSVDKMERIVQSALNTYQDRVSEVVYGRLSETMKQQLTTLLDADPATPADSENPWSRLAKLKEDPGGVDLKNVLETGEKLRYLRTMELPDTLFADVDPKWIAVYCQRATAEPPSDLKDHPDAIRYTLLAAFCQVRQMEITDQLIDLLIQIIHKIGTRAERKIDKAAVKDIRRIYRKHEMLVKMSRASLSDPQGQVKEVIFGVVSADKLQRVVDEHDAHPLTYRQEVAQIMNRSYGRHYRRMLSVILDTLQFRSNNPDYQPVLKALKVVEKYMTRRNLSLYPLDEDIPLEGVVRPGWREVVVVTQQGKERIRRLDYELCVLGMLRETLRVTEIWVEGANKYGNPDKADPFITVEDYIKSLNLREDFQNKVLYPLLLAEWCVELDEFKTFSAYNAFKYVVTSRPRSLQGIITANEVVGGTCAYVQAMQVKLAQTRIICSTNITHLSQAEQQLTVHDANSGSHTFDHLIIATDATQASDYLMPFAWAEKRRAELDRIRYFKTTIAVHSDPRFMPANPHHWSVVNTRYDATHSSNTIWKKWRSKRPIFRSWVTFDPEMPTPLYHVRTWGFLQFPSKR